MFATKLASLVAALVTIAVGAQAADLRMPAYPGVEQEIEQPVELGTGWYLRGDVGQSLDQKVTVSTLANGTLGTITVKDKLNADIGFGYKFNNWFRLDATFEGNALRGPSTGLAVAPNTLFTTGGNRRAIFATGYLDLGTWYGLSPYVGAAVGGARTTIEGASDPTPGTPVPTTVRRTQFAWGLTAGLAYSFDRHAALDIGYRYTDYGRFTGTINPVAFQMSNMREHQVRIGIRYLID